MANAATTSTTGFNRELGNQLHVHAVLQLVDVHAVVDLDLGLIELWLVELRHVGVELGLHA